MYKIFATVAFLAVVSAAPADHQATSFASFNDNHNSIHHIDSAPAKYAAPAAPAKAAVPVYQSAPVYQYAAPSAPIYAAPVAKYAAPAAPTYAAPVAKYAAPAAPIYAAPVAKYAVAPVAKYAAAPAHAHHEEEYGPAQYEFAYAIADPHTGDFHSQQEHRDGHNVVGQYSLHEADGTVRIVKYTADKNGFNAVVEKQGHPTEAPAYKKVVAVAAAPQYHH